MGSVAPAASECGPLDLSLSLTHSHHTITTMSWPSFYGYKYTPIGLRQREKKDDTGTRSICTTVHLPQGGHLLDIERQYGIDGSMSKRETQNMAPNDAIPAIAESLPAPRAMSPAANPGSSTLPSDFFDTPRKSFADFERQADDIIANFRARQGTGLDKFLNRI